MPVKLFTGLPGAGKTACLVAELLKLKETEPERPVYALGIDGLAEGVAEPLSQERLERWWELSPGAIIAIDEAQEPGLMPLDQGKPADWIKRISKVRHEGMDFLLTTQHPSMLSSYVRRLVDQHVHAVRKFNTKIVMRYRWGRCMDNCEKDSAHRSAQTEVGTLPAEVFDLYKSANAHNMKRRIPMRVYVLPALVVLAVVAAVSVPFVLKRLQAKSQAAAPLVASVPQAQVSSQTVTNVDMDLRRKDFTKWMEPRIPGLLWTAPAFDELPVRSMPRVFCVAVADGRTYCRSEQGTRVSVPDDVARQIARDGAYNPFLDDRREAPARSESSGRERGQGGAVTAGFAQQPQSPPSLPVTGSGPTGQGIHATYVPPTYGQWSPDGF